jgi:hypothetical protein
MILRMIFRHMITPRAGIRRHPQSQGTAPELHVRVRGAALTQNSIVRWASITTNHSTQLLHINVVKTA